MAASAVPLKQARQRSCLVTAVRSVLLALPRHVSDEEVSELLGEDPDGCVWEIAVLRLTSASGLDIHVDDITGCNESEITEIVTDLDSPAAVIVTIAPIISPEVFKGFAIPKVVEIDHAVVITFILENSDGQLVRFMDPWRGEIRDEKGDLFWSWWDLAGGRALVIRD
jgi:uncharacterized protein YvpB